jgi:hypothetical protein
MYQVRIDVKGAQQIEYPADDAGVIGLAQAVIGAEAVLPPAQQFPGLAALQQRTTAASEGLRRFEAGRADTSAAAPSVEQAFAAAQEAVRDIISGLTYFHRRELPVLEQWGVEVVSSSSGTRTRIPKTQDEVLKMLAKAIEQEQSLPESQRLPHPKLADIVAIRAALVTALEKRAEASTQREQGMLMRVAETGTLFQLLQLCAHWHIVMDFGGVVDSRLQSMGFTVVAVPPKPVKPPKPIEPLPPTVADAVA